MRISVVESAARALEVKCTRDDLVVRLADGRIISVPLAWFPRLRRATPAQRKRWVLLGDGAGIHWPTLDEDISVMGLLRGESASGTPTKAREAAAPRRRRIARGPARR